MSNPLLYFFEKQQYAYACEPRWPGLLSVVSVMLLGALPAGIGWPVLLLTVTLALATFVLEKTRNYE